MIRRPTIRFKQRVGVACLLALVSVVVRAQAPEVSAPVVLDRVVAVVNNQTILASDVDEEIRLAVLDPGRSDLDALPPARALDQLISRTLIQQQIRQQDEKAALPSQQDIRMRVDEIRRELPACVRAKCSTDPGWIAFLAGHHLTAERVDVYMRSRLEILNFIEQRFRQGIRIPPQDVEKYYRETLLPLYAPNDTVPSLDKVSSRIEEILLEQQVSALFDDWLKNLRSQGNIEILAPALESAEAAGGRAGASQ